MQSASKNVPLTSSFNLTLFTTNTKGQSKENKRKAQWQWARDNYADIVLLQETHSTKEVEQIWAKQWSGKAYFAHGESNSKGVAILIRPGLEFMEKHVIVDHSGRYILLKAEVCKQKVAIVNVYAPNDEQTQIRFYTELLQLLHQQYDKDYSLIIGGDFNVVLNPELDKKGGQNRPRQRVVDILETILQDFSLMDVWRAKNPNKQEYTWAQPNYTIQCRLDMWLIPNDWLQITKMVKIVTTIQTDHKTVILKLQGQGYIPRGPGIWKLNNTVLHEKKYQDLVRNVLARELQDQESDPRIVWVIIKRQVAQVTQDYCKARAQKRRQKENEIAKELEELDKKVHKLQEQDVKKYSELKKQLEDLYQERTQGAILRARARWLACGEQSSKYFYRMEKRQFTTQCIYQLRENGQEVSDMDEINGILHNFYEELYAGRENELENPEFQQFFDQRNIPQVTEEEIERLDGPITTQECKRALDQMANDKTPGPDGLTVEFYKTFWDDICHILIMTYDWAFEAGDLAYDQYEGIIRLIPKAGRDPLDKKNWRPITLLNVDYKILSKVLAGRLKVVIPRLVSHDQCGFVAKRYIGENIRLIIDLMEYMDQKHSEGILVSLDIEKAFDSVAHNFIIKVLQVFGFGPNFIRWIQIFQLDAQSAVLNNGYVSQQFKLGRGTRQGDPISGYLFILVIELLSIAIRANPQIKGIKIGEVELKLSQFADDTTVTLANEESVVHLFEVLDLFAKCSGLKVNKDKTQATGLGAWKDKKKDVHGLKIADDPLKILGIWFSHNKKLMHDRNVRGKIERMKSSLTVWNSNGLTIQGRIMILKTLGLSQLIYPLINLHIAQETLAEIDKFAFQFIWKGPKKAKIKRSTLIGDYSEGGLKAPCIFTMYKRLKCSWVNRLANEKEGTRWNFLIKEQLKSVGGINYLLQSKYCVKKLPSRLSKFYSEILEIYAQVNKCNEKPTQVPEIMSQMINNNQFITLEGRSIYSPILKRYKLDRVYNWIKNGKPLTLQDINLQGDNKISWLYYNQIISAIPKDWKKAIAGQPDYQQKTEPDAGEILGKLEIARRTKPATAIFTAIEKWNETTARKELSQWYKKFQLLRMITKETKLRMFQFKFLHRIIPTGKALYLYKLRENPYCYRCTQNNEERVTDTILHCLVNCPEVREFWEALTNLFEQKEGFTVPLEPDYCLFGVESRLGEVRKWNYISLLARYYIYNARREEKKLYLQEFLCILKAKLKAWSLITFPHEPFDQNWKQWM